MAKFLNTSAVTYYLEEMIKNANLFYGQQTLSWINGYCKTISKRME